MLLAVFVVVQSFGVCASGSGDVRITAEQWSRVSSPAEFKAIEGLGALIAVINQQPATDLTIHYRGGESGLLWARQFRNRLVALGIETGRIQMIQGVGKNYILEITVVHRQ